MHNIWGMIPLIPYTHIARNASSPNSSSTLDDVIVGHICEEDTENVPAQSVSWCVLWPLRRTQHLSVPLSVADGWL